jgi:osmoprotectant transport system ATP-binding protein
MAEGAALELAGVVKRYAGGATVGPVDLAVPEGGTVALIGPSGAGKSTLLRLMLGLVAPDAGEVRLGGARLDPRDPSARRRVGYVVQGGGLFPHLTAEGNVTLVARFLRWPAPRIRARLEELRSLTRLDPGVLSRFPDELSGGQAQRVGLVRALFLDPAVLLLDEPLAALDPLTRADLQDDLGALVRAVGKTAIVVTHDLAEAAALAGRLVLLRDGRVVQDGRLDELVLAPADPFAARFVRAQRALRLPGEGR